MAKTSVTVTKLDRKAPRKGRRSVLKEPVGGEEVTIFFPVLDMPEIVVMFGGDPARRYTITTQDAIAAIVKAGVKEESRKERRRTNGKKTDGK